jgi:mannosidase alpha-like ER degradation enhancer 2
MEKTWKQRCLPLLLLLSILSADTNHNNIIFLRQTAADGVTPEEATLLRDEVLPSLLPFLNLPLLLFNSP